MRTYEAFFRLFFKDLDPGRFPFKFSVEATNHCNLRCTTCPREESGRGYGHMEMELFARLAREAGGRNVLFYPQGFGESFLHPRFPEMLAEMNAAGVRYPVCITNATLLNEERCRVLLEAGPRVVVISLDGGSKEAYEAIRVNGDYDQVCANVRRLMAMRAELGLKRPDIVLSVIGNERVRPTLDALRAEWEPRLRERDEIFVCTPIRWGGTWVNADTVEPEPEPEVEHEPAPAPPTDPAAPRPPCRYLYKTLTVFYDGRATPCCADHACALEVGNVHEQSVEEIWNGPRVQELRRLHEEGRADEIELCRGCDEFVP